jgi:hypothetical protein
MMEIKCLEVRDANTFMPIICVRPVAQNEAQRYLLRRDGYRADSNEHCIIVIKPQCRGVSYDPYNWNDGARTMKVAHGWIESNWAQLKDGDVVDVEWILKEKPEKKISECEEWPA